MLFNNLVILRVWRVDKKGRCHLKQDAFWILLAFLLTEYGSIPIDTFLVGWTSINPSYFDVNYRGTIGFDTLPTEATTLLSKPSLPPTFFHRWARFIGHIFLGPTDGTFAHHLGSICRCTGTFGSECLWFPQSFQWDHPCAFSLD